jgi:DNA modification methylase
MRYLVRLVTPPGGVVFDPFTGSGTTGCAAVLEGFGFVGSELDPEYVEIAKARIEHWERKAVESKPKRLIGALF